MYPSPRVDSRTFRRLEVVVDLISYVGRRIRHRRLQSRRQYQAGLRSINGPPRSRRCPARISLLPAVHFPEMQAMLFQRPTPELLAVLVTLPQSFLLQTGTIVLTVVCGVVVAFALFVELRGASRQHVRGRNAASEPHNRAISANGADLQK